jgi:hypothetical protein
MRHLALKLISQKLSERFSHSGVPKKYFIRALPKELVANLGLSMKGLLLRMVCLELTTLKRGYLKMYFLAITQ